MRNAALLVHSRTCCRGIRLIRSEREMTTNNPTALTAAEAARVLGLASSTLAKLRLTGNGPTYCKLGRRVVYRRTDLEVWLESRVARDTSDAGARLPKSLTVRGSRTANPTTEHTGPVAGSERINRPMTRGRRRTLVPGNDEYNVIASENERGQR
jgi:predicted DNA-binding transcriptional regulator AlpA